MVNTNKGLICIKDLEQFMDDNLEVESIQGKNLADKWIDSDKHPTIKIETEYGYKIQGSFNHPIMTIKDSNNFKWKTLEEIDENDHVVINCKKDQVSSNFSLITEEDAKFLGCFLSRLQIKHESSGGYWHFVISHYNFDFHQFVLKKLEELSDLLGIDTNKHKIKVKVKKFKKQPLFEIHFNSKVLWKFLNEVINIQYDKKLRVLPNIVLQSSLSIQKIFLSYFFESIASVDMFNDKKVGVKGRILYESLSKHLVQQLQVMLLQFGIVSTSYMIEKKRKNLFKLKIDRYSDLLQFFKEINFVTNNKKKTLCDIIKNLPEKEENQSFLCVKVVSKQIIEKEQNVYSIRVNSKCHSFTANGFINHNTEAKLSKLAEFNMNGIQNGAVDFKSNYSDTLTEPITLPGIFPNLLANGGTGIAVGYHTNIPSHNLNELCNVIIAYINNNDVSLDELMSIMPGPDFPSGSYLINNEEIKKLYESGKGKLTFKAKYEVINDEKIVITELPPDVNRERLIEKLQQLCLIDKKIPRVANIQDLSTKSTKINIILQKGAILDIVINSLLEQTELIKNCSFVIRAVKNNTPHVFSLLEYIKDYVEYRRKCICKECTNILIKLKKKLYLQQGLQLVIASLSLAIRLIESAESDKEAKEALIKNFGIDEEQAENILEFKLRRLTKLNKADITDTINNLNDEIKINNDLLNNSSLVDQKIIQQLKELKLKFGDLRRTRIINEQVVVAREEKDVIILLTNKNNIRVISDEAYVNLIRSSALKEKTDVYIRKIDSNTGNMFLLILEDNSYVRLTFNDLLAWSSKVNIVNCYSLKEINDDTYVVCITQKGLILKIKYTGFKARIKKVTPVFNNCDKDDKIVYSQLIQSSNKNVITLITQKGIINRFYEQSFKEMITANKKGLTAINLKNDDLVSDAYISPYVETDKLIIYTKHSDHYGYKMISNDLVSIKSRTNRGATYIQFMSKDPGIVYKLLITGKDYLDVDNRGRFHPVALDSLTEGTKISRPEKIGYDPLTINYQL